MPKKSFILMRDLLGTVEIMTNEEAGKLLKAIINHVDGNEVDLPRELVFAFRPIQNQLDRDMKKYTDYVEKQKLNGAKGGRPKKTQANPKNPSLLPETQANPKNLVTVTDTVNDSDSDSKKDSDSKSKKENKRTGILDFSDWPSMPNDQLMEDWKSMRRQKKLPMTQTVVNGYAKELKKAADIGYTVDQCLTECVVRGWQGFKVDWMASDRRQQPENQQKQPKPLL